MLGRYRTEGKTTLLLLESAGVLMDAVKIVEALKAAYDTRSAEVDEVWFLHCVAGETVNVHNLCRATSGYLTRIRARSLRTIRRDRG
jgi:hypothetical protein